jgi:hypothetical protein
MSHASGFDQSSAARILPVIRIEELFQTEVELHSLLVEVPELPTALKRDPGFEPATSTWENGFR